jgi:hypothetical protein
MAKPRSVIFTPCGDISRVYGSEQTGNAKTELVDLDQIEDFHRIDVNLFGKLPNSRQRLKRV